MNKNSYGTTLIMRVYEISRKRLRGQVGRRLECTGEQKRLCWLFAFGVFFRVRSCIGISLLNFVSFFYKLNLCLKSKQLWVFYRPGQQSLTILPGFWYNLFLS